MELNSLQNILNFSFIHDHLSTSGQPTPEEFAEIRAQGFSTVINLALTDASNALQNEDRICLELGLDYIQIPLYWECPSASAALLTLDMIAHLVQEQSVWLHCAKNWRVSALMYLYRRYYMNVDIEEAAEHLQKIWTPNDTWTGLIHAVELQLKARQSTYEISKIS